MSLSVRWIVFTAFAFLFYSCKESSNSRFLKAETVLSLQKLKVDSGAVVDIKMDTSYIPQLAFLCVQNSDSLLYLDLYPEQKKYELGSYNFQKQKFTRSGIFFNTDGPDDIDGSSNVLENFNYINPDSILFMNEFGLLIANAKGKVVDRGQLNYNFNRNYNLYIRSTSAGLSVHSGNICLASCRSDDAEFFETSALKTFNIKTKKISELPLQYSALYEQEGKFYGYLSEVQISYGKDEKVILTFPIDPNIYVYDPKTEQTVVKGGDSRYISSPLKPLSYEEQQDKEKIRIFSLTEPQYGKMYYDTQRSIYYRIVQHPMQYKRTDGKFNAERDKPSSLLVFDDQLNLINEYYLGAGYNVYFPLVTNEGLYILKIPGSDKKLQYKVFDFERI